MAQAQQAARRILQPQGKVRRAQHLDIFQPEQAVGRKQKHGYIFVVVPSWVYLWLLRQSYRDTCGRGSEVYRRPHQLLHGIARFHRWVSTRRPAWAVVGAKREAQALAFADSMTHEALPRLRANGVRRIADNALHGATHLELLHAANTCLLIGLQVGRNAFATHHTIHPLPNHQRTGFLRRVRKCLFERWLSQHTGGRSTQHQGYEKVKRTESIHDWHGRGLRRTSGRDACRASTGRG